ncbi:DNA-(apurinic or apyrimidinic site) lyase [Kytococcus aerolatus]|uniref:Formamidopyrimidine-DNA glycosylase n=1 Tax=Kytococcus aerolatus TaxID=592308 RepID=A0A212U1L6_9MICO|nr:bifunctional DNA-formamidopyrimidine glycosylase/DNA-(apurinic or apyrimidinic site) lyase [Kytococcus aerolatus]SNC72147.1 DNA-(apurinic or apyrimidinic site) lyase [Kytococcus aerolatus]
MPELPEVEVVRRGLADHVVGRRIELADVRGERVARRHPGGADALARALTGRVLTAARRRGKFLWLPLDDGHALLTHLGMSGQMLVLPPEEPALRHEHARLDFTDGGPSLRFVDQRTFGGWSAPTLLPDPFGGDHPGGVPATATHIAPDPFEPAFDPAGVADRLRSRRGPVKRALLDQGVVSGVGNIYADEALWRIGLHGERPGTALTGPTARRLLEHLQEVMGEALDQGGTSFDALYVNVNGASGYFDRRLAVYGQQGRECPRCGATVLRSPFDGRSSHWCPRCQTRPRTAPRGTPH